jgi:hypothetical protein
MDTKFSDTYRTSFLTLDRYLQQSNAAQFYFRPLLPPLNTATGEFFSLSPAQGTDPSIRINKYSSNGTFLGFGYLYDSSFNVPPGGGVDVSGGYWTLTGSNIYNNNPGFVGVGTAGPATATLDVSGNTRIHGPTLSNLLFVGDASLNNPSAEQDTVKVGIAGKGGQLAIGDDGKGVMRLLNAFGDTYIEAGTNFASGSTGRLVFASMFDASSKPTMTVNTGTDEVLISNRFLNPLLPGYKLTVDGSANVGGILNVAQGIANLGALFNIGDITTNGKLYSGHHYPQLSYTYDLGSPSAYWRDLYLSSGTIYMGSSSQIRSSNPLTLDLSGNGGLYVTSNTTVGRVYDSAFNPAPALTPQTITQLLTNYSVIVSGTVSPIPLGTVPTKGNYIIKQEWNFGASSDMKGGNIYTTLITAIGTYYICIPAFTIPGSGPSVSTTYTTFGGFISGDAPSITIDTTEINTAGGSLTGTTVTVSILYLSASP